MLNAAEGPEQQLRSELDAALAEFNASSMQLADVDRFGSRIRAAVAASVVSLAPSLAADPKLRKQADMYGTPARHIVLVVVSEAARNQMAVNAQEGTRGTIGADARRAMALMLNEGALQAKIETAAIEAAIAAHETGEQDTEQQQAPAGETEQQQPAAGAKGRREQAAAGQTSSCCSAAMWRIDGAGIGGAGESASGRRAVTSASEAGTSGSESPRAGSTRSASETLPVYSSLQGWLRIDDPLAYGTQWYRALDWPDPALGFPDWQMLGGWHGIYIHLTANSSVMDGLNQPVRLASGVWVDPDGRAALSLSVDMDVECARQVYSKDATYEGGTDTIDYSSTYKLESTAGGCLPGFFNTMIGTTAYCEPIQTEESTESLEQYWTEAGQSTIPPHCAESQVLKYFGHEICDYYEGKGNVYLAECDCIKSGVVPGPGRLWGFCDSLSPAGVDCDKIAAGDTDELAVLATKLRGKENDTEDKSRFELHGISEAVVSNLAARRLVRSLRRLPGMQGTFPACVYPPCSSLNSNTAYVDARITRSERGQCPPVRCTALIDVSWVGGDVTVRNNTLRVNCFGGDCMNAEGQPKCRNGGRCMVDATCNCEGTGYHGEHCEINDATGEVDGGGGTPDVNLDEGEGGEGGEGDETQEENFFDRPLPGIHISMADMKNPKLIARAGLIAGALVGAIVLLKVIVNIGKKGRRREWEVAS